MQLDWSPIRKELKRWNEQGLTLPIWWRDDDATESSGPLDQLIKLSEASNVPVHLAVIPRNATKDLAAIVTQTDALIPVVHGWAHKNHQPKGERRCEFGDARPVASRKEEAAEGLRRLRILMGDQVAAMFAPPWNHLPKDFAPELADLGYRVLSQANPRRVKEKAPGLLQINTHIDPLYWRPANHLSDPALLIDKMTNQLKQRRRGDADQSEPYGLLTHHLAHTPDVWEFCRQYWSELLEGPTELYRCS